MYKVSDSEREVLEALWAGEPLTAKQVVETLSQKTEWHEKTIKTLLDRLLKKEVVQLANFIENNDVNEDDIKELEKLVQRIKANKDA